MCAEIYAKTCSNITAETDAQNIVFDLCFIHSRMASKTLRATMILYAHDTRQNKTKSTGQYTSAKCEREAYGEEQLNRTILLFEEVHSHFFESIFL